MEHSHTIIELLLVIAILGIIYSMYVGSLARAREAAERAICKQYQWEWKSLRETQDIPNMVRVADRCFNCHASAPPNW